MQSIYVQESDIRKQVEKLSDPCYPTFSFKRLERVGEITVSGNMVETLEIAIEIRLGDHPYKDEIETLVKLAAAAGSGVLDEDQAYSQVTVTFSDWSVGLLDVEEQKLFLAEHERRYGDTRKSFAKATGSTSSSECSECSGTGVITCGECYGSGRHGTYPNPSDCWRCEGARQFECAACEGSGQV
jgi:hypothetical protein